MYRRADRVVVLSHAFKRLLVERYRITPWTIEVIRPAVDLDRFTPPPVGADPRAALELPAEGPWWSRYAGSCLGWGWTPCCGPGRRS